ncbi:MAG: FHA domain-containing protein [Hyphomicrobiaceae bacterium]
MLARIFEFLFEFGVPYSDNVTATVSVVRLFLEQDLITRTLGVLLPHAGRFWMYYAAAGAAAVLLLSLFWMMKLKQRPSAHVAAENNLEENDLEQIYHRYSVSDTQPRAAAGSLKRASAEDGLQALNSPVFAWLERLDDPGNRIAIRRKSEKIGRHSTNDIVLADSSVHRYHVVLAMNEYANFVLTDLGGVNGCYVNGIRSQSKILENGDIVELGNVKLKFHKPLSV